MWKKYIDPNFIVSNKSVNNSVNATYFQQNMRLLYKYFYSEKIFVHRMKLIFFLKNEDKHLSNSCRWYYRTKGKRQAKIGYRLGNIPSFVPLNQGVC